MACCARPNVGRVRQKIMVFIAYWRAEPGQILAGRTSKTPYYYYYYCYYYYHYYYYYYYYYYFYYYYYY